MSNNNNVRKDGIKKGLIASLISAVVLMSLLLSTVNVGATTSASLYGTVSSYAPAWINASSVGACVLQLDLLLETDTPRINSINVTFNNVTGNFNATTDFRPLANSTNSGVMLYYDTNGNGFQTSDTRLFFDNPEWVTTNSVDGTDVEPNNYVDYYYQVNFSSPAGLIIPGSLPIHEYVYVVVKTNTTSYDGAKFNVSINATNIVGSDASNTSHTAIPASNLFSDYTTTLDTKAPGVLFDIAVNNYTALNNATACSNWTSSPYFSVNWSSAGDNGSQVSDYYYKIDSAPTTYNDGNSTGGSTVNYTFLDITSLGSGNHTMYIWSVDAAHNKGNNSIAYLRYDTTAPTLNNITITGTSGNTTWSNGTSVTLALSAIDSDSGMGTGSKMCFKNEVGGTWTSWESYATSKTWTMGSSDGIKTVYFKVKDVAGNENTTGLSDMIILDQTAPTVVNNGTVYSNAYGFAAKNDTVTLWANITDNPSSIGASGILFNATAGSWYVMVNITLLNNTWAVGWVEMKNATGDPTNFTYTMEVNWTTINALGDGDKWLQINATDNATNSNQSKYILVKVDMTAPIVTANPTVYPTFTNALGYTVNQTNATNGNTVTLNATVFDAGTLKYIMVNVTNITTDSSSGVWLNPPGLAGSRWLNLTQGAQINSTTYYYTGTVTVANATNGTQTLEVNATDYLNNSLDLGSVNVYMWTDNILPNVTSSWTDYNISLMPWVPGDGLNLTGVYHNATRTWTANGENVTLHVIVEDNSSPGVYGGSNISFVQVNIAALNSSKTWVNMTLETGAGWPTGVWMAENVTLYGATNGTKQLQVKAWDNASNLNSTHYIYVNVDNPPTVTANATGYLNYSWQTAAQNGTIINISVTVSDDDISGVKVFLNDTSLKGGLGENLTYLGPVWAVLTQISGTNTWYNNTINVSATADGTYNLTINATDIMGNWNNTKNVTVKVDNEIPSVTAADVNYINTAGWAKNDTKVTLYITAADLGVAGIYKVWANVTNITSRDTYPTGWLEMTNKSSISTANNWTLENITVSAVTGTYQIWFNRTDNASNANTLVCANVSIDNIAPNVTLAGYYNTTAGTGCTNLTSGIGNATVSQVNGANITLYVHVNDTTSGILYNTTATCRYITAYVHSINASLYWIDLQNNSATDAWNFTGSVIIGDTIGDGNYSITFNLTDNATTSNATTTWPCNITVWVHGTAPVIESTTGYYPDETPTRIYAAIPGHNITINATINDGSGCNMSWTNAVWVDVGLITTGSAGSWVAMNHTDWAGGTETSLNFSVNVTVGSGILSGTYNLTVYGVDLGGRSTNSSIVAVRFFWVNVSVDRDNPVVTNPVTVYQSGTAANSTALEWVNISVNVVDSPAGVYSNVTVYVGEVNLTDGCYMNKGVSPQSDISSSWAQMTRSGTTNIYWANITVDTGADGAHYLQVKAQDNVGYWYNDTKITVLIRTMGPSVAVTVALSGSLGTNNTGIIGSAVSIRANTTTDVANVSVDLSAFVNATGYYMSSYTDMSYVGNGVWYYNFTIYATPNNYTNNNSACGFNVTAYRSGYTGVNSTTAKIDAVRPTSIINQTMSQWWNNTLFNTYSGCIFLNWTHSEALNPIIATFKVYYKVGSTGTWTEWPISESNATCANFTSVTEGETYYFYVVVTDWAGNVEANYYDGSGNIVSAYNLTIGDIHTTIDTSFPASLSIIIDHPTDAGFNSTGIVNLTISGSDAGSGLGAISLSNDRNGTVWQPWFDFVSPVTNITGDQQYPAIYGKVMVWIDTGDIYAYNIDNKTSWQITSSGNIYGLCPPAIYGNYIVYCNDTLSGVPVDYNIYAFNIATGATTAICTNAGNQMFPAIYGTVVVWQGNVSGSASYNIYKYDISNPGAGTTQLTASGQAYTPAIYGDYVVYADQRSGSNDTYMYNLATSTETAVCTAAGAQQYPAIYSNYIVWQDNRNGNSDIYMYNINTGATTEVCTNTSSQEFPKIYGDYIVWQDNRYDITNYDIFMYTISTGKETEVTLNSLDTTAQGYPAVYSGDSDKYIVWQDNRYGGTYDIYMQQMGASKTMSYMYWGLTDDTGVNGNTTDGTKTVYVRVRDWANNSVNNSMSLNDTIIYDTNAPTGLTIVINYNATLGTGDNITTNRTVTLTLGAIDPTNYAWDGVISNITPGYYLVALRNKTTGSWGSWSAWMLWNGNGTYTYTLSPGDGDRVVGFLIKDRAGNNATAASDSILLNTGAPTITCTVVGTEWDPSGYDASGNTWYNNTPVYVNLSATDAQDISILWYKVTFANGTDIAGNTPMWKNCTTEDKNWINVSAYSSANVSDANFTFSKEGIHRIDYYAQNLNASTNGTGTFYIRIDRTKSNITLSPNVTYAGNMNCFNTIMTITIVSYDNSSEDPANATQSGVNWTKYRVWKEGAVGTFSSGYYNAIGAWVALDANYPGEWVHSYNSSGASTCVSLRLLEEGNYSIEVNTSDFAGNNNWTANLTAAQVLAGLTFNGTQYLNLTWIRIDMTKPVAVFNPSGVTNGIQGLKNNTTVSSVYYTNSSYVVLRPNAYDIGVGPSNNANASGLWRFQVSNDGIDWYGRNATGVLTINEYVNWSLNTTTTCNWWMVNESVAGNYNKTVYIRMYDNASNYADATVWIILDTLKPTATVSVSPGIAYTDATIMNTTIFNITWSGSDVYDSLNGSGINNYFVQYNYSDTSGANWTGWIWNNSVGAAGTSQFEGVDGRIYYFRCRATDRLGWVYDWANCSAPIKVIVDTTKPTSSADAITTYWHNAALTITAAASDSSTGTASGLLSVDLLYKYSLDNSTSWSDWTLFGTDTDTASWSWDFTFTSDGYYKFCTRAKDRGYNVETALPTDYDTIAGYDTVAPITGTPTLTGTLGENSWYTTEVTVTLTATDASPSSGGLTVQYYVDSGDWTTYTVVFTITTEGIHTVYYRTTDRAGNVESTKTKEVKIDLTNPTADSIAINTGTAYTNTETVALTVSASDAMAGVANMSFKNEVTGTWSDWAAYSTEPIAWAISTGSDGLRTVYFKVKDNAGRVSDVISDTITLDKTAPTTTPTPSGTTGDNSWYVSDVVVTLAGDDGTGSDIASIQYNLDSAGWITYTTPFTVSADGSHTVQYKATDNAGNTAIASSTTFKIDQTPPTSYVLTLSTYQTASTSFTVQWTGSDPTSGSGVVVGYTIQVKDGATGTWTDWKTNVLDTAATYIGTDEHTYYFRSKAKDQAGKVETDYTDTGDTYTTVDTIAPTDLSISIAAGAYTSTTSVTLTLSATGATQMMVSESSAFIGATWETYDTSKAWTLSTDDGVKTVYFKCKDVASNIGGPVYDTITLDTTAPTTGTISINAGAGYTTTLAVTLTLSASDANGIASMCFSNDGTTYSTYEAYATSKSWTLTTGDVTKTVYVKYKDVAGLVSTAFTDTIILDTTAPTGTISIGEDAEYTTTRAVTLTLSGSDTNGVAYMCFSNDGTTYSTYEAYATSKSWTLTAVDGTKTVYVKYKDIAGVESAAITDTIILDTTAPADLSISINAGAGYTKVTNVTLTLAATGATQMMVSESSAFTGATWETYGTSKTLTLSTTDGLKTVYFKCKDAAGNVADTVSDTITLDTTAPTVTIVGGDVSVKYSDKKVTFTATVSEEVTAYAWNIVDAAGTTLTTASASSVTYDFPKDDTYTVTLTVTDKAGNTGTATSTVTVKPKPAPPFIPGFDMISLFAAFGIALTVLALMKKRKH